MFEESLVESQITRASATKRWTMAGSALFQLAIALTLIAIPLTQPERLTFHVETPLVFAPAPPRPPLPIQSQQARATDTTAAASPISSTRLVPSPILRDHAQISDAPPIIGPIGMSIGDNSVISNIIAGTHSRPAASPTPAAPPKRIVVSRGISEGMLLAPIRPVYPPIARAVGVSGTVIVEAIISKTGTIESLRAVSGPDMLRNAALDAIRTARYRPYLLNGEPVETQTTFTINFKMGG